MHKKARMAKLCGPFVAVLELHTMDKRRRKDADNRVKAVLDYAVRIGLIEDDRFAEWVMVGWTHDPTRAPYGALLTLWPWQREKGLPELAALVAKSGR